MAQKTLRQVTTVPPVKSAAAGAVVPVVAATVSNITSTPSYGTYFNIGDTAYYLSPNGVQIPVIISAVTPGGVKTSDGGQALYLVTPDITGTTNILGGASPAQIKGVVASQLSSR